MRMWMRGVFVGLIVAVALGSPIAGAAAAQERTSFLGPEEGETLTDWTARWLDGPVQYIATEDEVKTFNELTTTRQKLQFIRLFWERRDPTIRDTENAFVDEFVRRVEYADEEFGEGQLARSGTPGWQTAFGQVVLVVGPPQRTERQLGFPSTISARPVILWGYDARFPEWPTNEKLMFVFQRGRWRLAPPSNFGEPRSASTEARNMERLQRLNEIPNDFVRVSQAMIEESLVQTVNYNDVVNAVGAEVAFSDAAISFAWDTAFAPGEGGKVEVALTLIWRMESLVFHAVDDDLETEMVITALLSGEDGEPIAEGVERVNFTVPAGDLAARGDEIVTKILTLSVAPGTYELRIALDDLLLGYRSVVTSDLVVPSR